MTYDWDYENWRTAFGTVVIEREGVMDKNERLARELFEWWLSDLDIPSWCQKGKDRTCNGAWFMYAKDWHPDGTDAQSDAQADMVVRKVAELRKGQREGYVCWIIRTFLNCDGNPMYRVELWKDGDRFYESKDVTNRNEHIVAAAIAALDAEKPKPHRCKEMDSFVEWVPNPRVGWHNFCITGKAVISARFCHKCGADLNA